ncbi:MAG TPA: hypothetical protein VJV23_03870 [Candidatus Polarisedimenticolia bacterium]|nr:hypothetical protein [Candidatus Polarisedimenticolia bacterium]
MDRFRHSAAPGAGLRSIIPLVCLALALPGTALAAIKIPEQVAAGQKREWDGVPMTEAQMMRMDEIIKCLEMLGVITKVVDGMQKTFDLGKAAKCLKEMLRPSEKGRMPRICVDVGSTTNVAGTLSGRNAEGDCDPKLARMNIKASLLDGAKERAVSALAHEWLHTTQASGLTGAAAARNEADANWLQIEILTRLIADLQAQIDNPSTPAGDKPGLEKRKQAAMNEKGIVERSYEEKAKEAGGAGSQGPGRTKKVGASTFWRPDGGEYFSSYSYPVVRSFSSSPESDGTVQDFDLSPHGIRHPLTMVLLDGISGPTGGEVLAVAGIDDPNMNDTGTTGGIVYLEAREGQTSLLSPSVTLPGTHPSSLVYQPASDRLCLLDTLGERILEVQASTPGGLPDVPGPAPWATAATFPAIGQSLTITHDPITGLDDHVLAYRHDARTEGLSRVLAEQNLAAQVFRVQRQVGSVGSLTYGAEVFLIPGIRDVFDVSRSADVVGAPGSMLVLRVTDSLGLTDGPIVSAGGIGNQVRTTMLFDPQPTGTHLKLTDVSHPALASPEILVVQPAAAGIPALSTVPLALLAAGILLIGWIAMWRTGRI